MALAAACRSHARGRGPAGHGPANRRAGRVAARRARNRASTGKPGGEFAVPQHSSCRALARRQEHREAEPLLQEIVKMTLARPGPDGWSAARFELEAIAKTARQSGDWNLSESVARD